MICSCCDLPAPTLFTTGECWPCKVPRDYWTPEFWAEARPNNEEAECSTSGSE